MLLSHKRCYKFLQWCSAVMAVHALSLPEESTLGLWSGMGSGLLVRPLNSAVKQNTAALYTNHSLCWVTVTTSSLQNRKTGPGHYGPYLLDKTENLYNSLTRYNSEWQINSTAATLGSVQWLSDWAIRQHRLQRRVGDPTLQSMLSNSFTTHCVHSWRLKSDLRQTLRRMHCVWTTHCVVTRHCWQHPVCPLEQ